MNRHAYASVVAIVLGLIPSLAAAQSTEFTVSVQSAAVRKAPSTGSPIVGQAPRGAVLEVTRDIGAWVKVAWPEAPDGIGYVHTSMGKIAQRATREERLATTFASLPPPEPVDMPLLTADQPAASIDMSTTRTIYVPPPTHVFGLGAQMTGASGATPGFGFTSRIWSRSRLGVQLDLSQTTMTSTLSPERLRSTQFAPSVIYSLPDYVSDSVWLRPVLRRRRGVDAREADERHARGQRRGVRQPVRVSRLRRRRTVDSQHAQVRDQRRPWLSVVAAAVCRLRSRWRRIRGLRSLVREVGEGHSGPLTQGDLRLKPRAATMP